MDSSPRRAFALLFACLVCVGMGQSMLFSILPPAAREIGISPFQVSTIFAVSASIWVFLSPMWGRRSDITGRRTVIIIGLLGYALSMGALAAVIDIGMHHLLPAVAVYPLMIATRSIFGLVGSGTGPASQAYIAERTSRAERTAGVALVSAAMGLGETIGPGIGAALAALHLLAPLYLSAALAVVSALTIWRFLPEEGPPRHAPTPRRTRMRVTDRRIFPFLVVATAMQASRATTVITFAFFLQDRLQLDAQQTVQYSGIGFVVLAVSGLVAQLGIVQRFQPRAQALMRAGAAFMVAAFLLVIVGPTFAVYLTAMMCLGVGLGLLRPGAGAAASLSVGADEQGSAAGVVGGVSVVGNVFGPMIGTLLYGLAPTGPYVFNAALMAGALVVVLSSRRVRGVRA